MINPEILNLCIPHQSTTKKQRFLIPNLHIDRSKFFCTQIGESNKGFVPINLNLKNFPLFDTFNVGVIPSSFTECSSIMT